MEAGSWNREADGKIREAGVDADARSLVDRAVRQGNVAVLLMNVLRPSQTRRIRNLVVTPEDVVVGAQMAITGNNILLIGETSEIQKIADVLVAQITPRGRWLARLIGRTNQGLRVLQLI